MQLIISNLSPACTRDNLLSVLKEFGRVSRVVFLKEDQTPPSTRIAVAEMPNEEEALAVIKYLSGDIINGLPLNIVTMEVDAASQANPAPPATSSPNQEVA